MDDFKKQIREQCYIHEENDSTKPQLAFRKIACDNTRASFKHLSLNKNSGISILSNTRDNIHIECPPTLYDVKMPSDIIEDAHEWIETKQGLDDLVEKLKLEKFIAVDTEHHSSRSYLGFIALLQISTKDRDYLIDTIKLHDSMDILRPVFADGSICKVLHGATQDMLWLMRDFHIDVVNMFDTGVAYQKLYKTNDRPGLAFLLHKYCNVGSNKFVRKKDWRTRPLTEDMKTYAVMDTRYLLYLASILMTKLNEKDNNMYESACQESNKMCLKQYIKANGDSPARKDTRKSVNKNKGGSMVSFSTTKKAREICIWRDIMARIHDESLDFVMSENDVYALASGTPVNALRNHSLVVMSHMTSLMDVLDKGFVFDDNPIIENCIGPNGTCKLTPFNSGLQNTLLEFKPTNYATTLSGEKTPKLTSKTKGICEACKEFVERRMFKTIPPCYKDNFTYEFHYVFNKLNINLCNICEERATVVNDKLNQETFQIYRNDLNNAEEKVKGKGKVKQKGKFGDHSDHGNNVVKCIMSKPPIYKIDQEYLIQEIKERFDDMPKEKAKHASVQDFVKHYGRLAIFVKTWQQRLLQTLANEKGKRI